MNSKCSFQIGGTEDAGRGPSTTARLWDALRAGAWLRPDRCPLPVSLPMKAREGLGCECVVLFGSFDITNLVG